VAVRAPHILVARALRKAREERGESLERAADRTNISAEYLRALENDAPLSTFPSPMYARLFLRTYARYLGLSEEPLVDAFGQRHGADGPPDIGTPLSARPLKRSAIRHAAEAATGIAPMRRPSVRTRVIIRLAARRTSRIALPKRPAPGRPSPARLSPARLAAGLCIAIVALVAVPALILSRHGTPAVAKQRSAPKGPVLQVLPDGSRTILPGHRVVAFYGQARTSELGILGGGTPDSQADELLKQAKAYDLGDVPMMPEFELIAVVASRHPGPDGLYRFRTGPAVVQAYLDAIRRIHGVLVLDIQPGRADFMTEVKQYEMFLKQPDVGLALDGEWHVGRGEVPGVVIGSIDGHTVNQVSSYLSALVEQNGLPQKLFIVHQFTPSEILNRRLIVNRPGLATVLDIDGYGGPLTKTLKYDQLTAGTGRFFHGFKLYYKQDPNLMPPQSVLALRPTPDVIIYQ
jgi:transcriptional regulator with XRE-family HTH domain